MAQAAVSGQRGEAKWSWSGGYGDKRVGMGDAAIGCSVGIGAEGWLGWEG